MALPQTQAEASAQDEAWGKQYDEQQAAQKAQEQAAKQPPTFLQHWMAPVGQATASVVDRAVSEAEQWGIAGRRLGQDVNAGLANMAVGLADTAKTAVASSGEGLSAAGDPAHAQEAMNPPSSPLWDHARATVLDFRDAMQVQDPTWVDKGTQALAQFAVPFAGYSRALGGIGRFANWVGSGILADATVQPIDTPRESTADMIALGRHVEQKYLGALSTAGGTSAINAYISFLADNSSHTDAEAKFKQVLDSVIPNAAFTGLLLGGGSVLRQGTRVLRYAAENFGGGPLAGSLAAQKGMIAYHGTAADFDEFSDAAIGTGEGNQTFGHGHYFAENPATAGTYQQMAVRRNGAAGVVLKDAQDAVRKAGGRAQAYSDLSQNLTTEGNPNRRAQIQKVMDLIKSGNYTAGLGKLMHVDIADEHVAAMMDWDAPISTQPGLQKVLANLDVKVVPEGGNYRVMINGRPGQMYADRRAALSDTDLLRGAASPTLTNANVPTKPAGEVNAGVLYDQLASALGGQKAASEFLSRRGIPGIKYLDQGSRDTGEGTRNIVLFNPKHAKIVKKE